MATKDGYVIQLNEIWAKVKRGTSPADVNQPSDAKIGNGFDYGEKPSHSTFNWIMYKVMSSAVAFQQTGILFWDGTIEYQKHAISQDKTTGVVYQAIKGDKNNKNLGKALTDTAYWKVGIEDNDGFVKKRGNQDPGDSKGGTITGDIVITNKARLIIEA